MHVNDVVIPAPGTEIKASPPLERVLVNSMRKPLTAVQGKIVSTQKQIPLLSTRLGVTIFGFGS